MILSVWSQTGSYPSRRLVDTGHEDDLSNEEAEAQVLMYGVAIVLQIPGIVKQAELQLKTWRQRIWQDLGGSGKARVNTCNCPSTGPAFVKLVSPQDSCGTDCFLQSKHRLPSKTSCGAHWVWLNISKM